MCSAVLCKKVREHFNPLAPIYGLFCHLCGEGETIPLKQQYNVLKYTRNLFLIKFYCYTLNTSKPKTLLKCSKKVKTENPIKG